MPVTVSRDPFARTELVRETVPVGARSPCWWCGQPGRFTYSTETDGGRTYPHPGVFCSVYCFRTYHE